MYDFTDMLIHRVRQCMSLIIAGMDNLFRKIIRDFRKSSTHGGRRGINLGFCWENQGKEITKKVYIYVEGY
jgi:hypothetical protein